MKPTVPVLLVFFLCLFAAIDICASVVDGVSSPQVSKGSMLTVTKTEDTSDGVCDADCSLREAVTAAASGDTVVFSTLFNTPQTITLTLGQITIDKNLTITGTGQNLTTLSGNNASRIIFITGGVTIHLSNLTFRDGNMGISDPFGGAIFVDSSTLNVSNATFTNNRVGFPTGGGGGAIYGYESTLTLSNLTVTENFSQGGLAIQGRSVDIQYSVVRQNTGGGVEGITLSVRRCVISDNTRLGIGGHHSTIIDSTITNNANGGVSDGDANSTMTIESCLISGNIRDPGGSGVLSQGVTVIRDTKIINNQALGLGAGGIFNAGTLYLINSVVSGNTSSSSGLGNDGGGGIRNSAGSLFVINSTVSGNSASGVPGAGGGIYSRNVEQLLGRVYLVNSTVANNTSSGPGGAIHVDSNGEGVFSNSIAAANNSTGTTQEDVSGIMTSNGINLIGNTTGSSGWVAGDVLNVNPMLGPLADNGGGTMTHALLPGGPAINAGNNSVAIDPQTQMPLTTDQRGFLRFYGGTVDIGAYELQPEITGTIIYGNATGSPTPRFVSGVLLTALGSPNVLATSRSDGTYGLGGFGSGAYTVTPWKTGGANGISSFDAGLIAKHVAGLQPLMGNQLIVADVSGNGTLSSFDSGQIARYTVGISGFGSSANWIFVPVNRTYSSVNSSMSGEDFIALLMGDVSGNWTPVSSRPLAGGSGDDRVESSALTNVRASAFGSPSFARLFAEKLCFSGAPKIDSRLRRVLLGEETAAQPQGFGVQGRRSTASPQIERQSRDLSLFGPGAFTGAAPLLMPVSSMRSVSDYHSLIAMDDMEKAKAKWRAEEALRKCLPKEGELPGWADDWLANVWQGGKSDIPAKHGLPIVVDPGNPNVMWRVGATEDRLKRVKGMDGCLFKSMDGGAKWDVLHHTYMNQWKYVSSLAVTRDTKGKTILLAGVMNESFSVATDKGIMRSDDGGETWYRVCDGLVALSVAFDPNNPQNAIAEIVAPQDIEFGNPFPTNRVVFSTDGGKHWMTATRNGLPLETNSETKMKQLVGRVKGAL